VVENFSARAMPALGLDFETLRAANRRLIYVSLPGFGSSGPYRDRVAFGPSVEPLTGLPSVMGYAPGAPRCTAMAVADPMCALSAASATLTALRERARTGAGCRVELSLHEAGVAYHGPWLVACQLAEAGVPEAMGNRHPEMAPHGVYPCAAGGADGDAHGDASEQWIAIACRDDAEWRALAALVDGLDAGASLAERRAAHDAIDAAIAAWTRTRSKEAAAETLQAAGVPAGAVNTAPDMLADVHVAARGFFVPLEDRTPVPGVPLRMRQCSSADWTPCPKLGADNAAVLQGWLGYDEERVRQLEADGVIFDAPPG